MNENDRAVWIALIGLLGSFVVSLTTIVSVVTAAVVVWMKLKEQRHESDARNQKVIAAVSQVGENVKVIEKATNSLTDRLVESTRAQAQAAGELKGRDDQKAEGKSSDTIQGQAEAKGA